MAAVYLATAPKSNSANAAIAAAREDVRKEGAGQVPGHLAGGMRPGDTRREYLYPHDYPGGWVKQQYLPAGLEGRHYYHPGDNPREAKVAAYLARLRDEVRDEPGSGRTAPGSAPSRGDRLED
jgi:putative ATPase